MITQNNNEQNVEQSKEEIKLPQMPPTKNPSAEQDLQIPLPPADMAKAQVKNDQGASPHDDSETETIGNPDELDKPANLGDKEQSKPIFKINTSPRVIVLPELSNKRKLNLRYPLLPPYAYAHIFWDEKNNEAVYYVEEPALDRTEQEILRLVKLGLEEMINISYIRAEKSNMLMDYLERTVQSILIELGIKISKKTYLNLMYYIYRDSIGLNKIEPLLHDYYIEDIECNGTNFPIYIVHRKYENLKTNVIIESHEESSDFVEKLAQKSGRYISYAKPLLDGTLPDGSRVNATYTDDVTTRGPTFTIRKFTKEPLTPTALMNFGTATAETFAYFWLAIEHKSNVMIIGETASGKTTLLNSIVNFIPYDARICSIEDTRELNLVHENWLPAVSRMGFGIPNMMGKEYGGISLYDLLRESFRQNPDYVIVGEVRGAEASVLFQGMASGHPSFGTFHAGSLEGFVRRLETPPINLPASLINSLDVVAVVIHNKEREKNIRRLKMVNEIVDIPSGIGKIESNVVFDWDPIEDKISFKEKSIVFNKISQRTGIPYKKIVEEWKVRTELLKVLADKKITDFKDFTDVIKAYYEDPTATLQKFGL